MSLESAMDEERREVMNLLEGRPASYRPGQSPPPRPLRSASPAAPVRSMLDIGPATTRHASIAGIGARVTPAPLRSAPLIGSMLDPHARAPARSPPEELGTAAAASSSTAEAPPRSMSDTSSSPMRRPHAGSDSSPSMPYSRNQFDMSSTVSGPARPKRNTQGGRKERSSMAAIMRGQELDTMAIGRNHEKHLMGSSSSQSPAGRRKNRSGSPGNRLNTNSFNPMPTPGKFVSETGKVIDLRNAYRKLSDANIMKSGSSLSSYGTKDAASRARLGSGETMSPDGELRLAKDLYAKEDGEEAIESSDDAASSDDDIARGRQRSRPESEEDESRTSTGKSTLQSRKSAQSLLAAAEEERLSVSSKYKVKSLLEPTVTVTGPGGEKISVKKQGVHPNTNYNAQLSRSGSPASDSEDMSDIRRAQRLSINLSPVDTAKKHTAIRTIVRGEYSRIQKEGMDGLRRLRNYLVATDLSSEAAYALEWTIGTVLRDGDTILAIYAIDGGDAIGKPGETEAVPGVDIGEGGKAIQESAAAIGRLTEASKSSAAVRFPSPLNALGSEQRPSRPASVDARVIPRFEKERLDAIHDISQTCLKFLRKTKLQVRIAIEVIHCKSPKNLITEAVSQPVSGLFCARFR